MPELLHFAGSPERSEHDTLPAEETDTVFRMVAIPLFSTESSTLVSYTDMMEHSTAQKLFTLKITTSTFEAAGMVRAKIKSPRAEDIYRIWNNFKAFKAVLSRILNLFLMFHRLKLLLVTSSLDHFSLRIRSSLLFQFYKDSKIMLERHLLILRTFCKKKSRNNKRKMIWIMNTLQPRLHRKRKSLQKPWQLLRIQLTTTVSCNCFTYEK